MATAEISIVTISFNQAEYLPITIKSVLEQQGTSVEYIIVDGKSSDGSHDVIRLYEDQLTWIKDIDDGPADGLLKGLLASSAPLIGFINADDFYEMGAFKRVVKFFHENPKIDFVTGFGEQITDSGEHLLVIPDRLSLMGLLYRGANIFQPGTFFRRDTLIRSDLFDVRNETCWDYELFCNFLKNGAIHQIIFTRLAYFRVSENSITGSGRLHSLHREEVEKLFCFYTGKGWSTTEKIYSLMSRFVYFCLRSLNHGKYVFGKLKP